MASSGKALRAALCASKGTAVSERRTFRALLGPAGLVAQHREGRKLRPALPTSAPAVWNDTEFFSHTQAPNICLSIKANDDGAASQRGRAAAQRDRRSRHVRCLEALGCSTGQNGLWAGPAQPCVPESSARTTGKQMSRLPRWRLRNWRPETLLGTSVTVARSVPTETPPPSKDVATLAPPRGASLPSASSWGHRLSFCLR